ncbi:MAG TPA: nicotinate-nucleotide adenylyltransferase [Thermoleophilia bacterium]|nr:nicotinate-nucleotide adenylyltransferase [Thermoleophilia bacterium]
MTQTRGERPSLGVLGGSFNPPHLGHLVIASDAWDQLGLERVLFVPAAAPPHKHIADGVPADVRLEMTRRAVAGDGRFAASTVEIDGQLRFTLDTLGALLTAHPGYTLDFIVGSDSLLQFASWHRPEAILDLCRLAVALRPGDDPTAVAEARDAWGGERVVLLDSVGVAVSSTLVRERVRRGAPIRYLVPQSVEETIVDLGLYRTS